MEDSYITESPWYQMILHRGKEEGIAQGLRRAIRRSLESRFGVLDSDLLAAIDAADETKLDDITDHFLTDSLLEMRARLGLA